MAKPPSAPSPKIRNKTATDIAGAGSGTVFLMLIKNFPDTFSLKPWLIIVAPWISIAIAYFWRFLVKKYDERTQKKELKKFIELLDASIATIIADPNIPDSEKERVKKERQEIKLHETTSLIKKIKSIQSNI